MSDILPASDEQAWPDDHEAPLTDVEPVEMVTCWRCEKPYAASQPKCETCLAANRSYENLDSPVRDSILKANSPAIVRVVWAFVAMAVVSILSATGIALTVDVMQPLQEPEVGQLLGWIAALEFADTIIVLWAMRWIPSAPIPMPSANQRVRAWALAGPLLIGVLALNFTYHSLLQNFLGIDPQANQIMVASSLWPLQLILLCVQPAIVEELFFRRVAMGAALEMISPTGAILITALLFALAHLGQPLSLPVLGLIGIALGYLRLASGHLWLPMLFHFLHNLAVMIGESWR